MKQYPPELRKVINSLAGHYGKEKRAPLTDPLQLIIWEASGYLVEDDRRQAAFETLHEEVGLEPGTLVSASLEKLIQIMRIGGIHPELRAKRLKEIAHIVLNDFDGDLKQALRLPFKQAIKAFKKFPSIGDPGAEKILLFTGTYPELALESNGLRVMLRLGFGEERKNYSASYKSVKEAVADQVGDDCDFLIEAHQLLRRHGKGLCRTNHPACPECPLKTMCEYYERLATSDPRSPRVGSHQ